MAQRLDYLLVQGAEVRQDHWCLRLVFTQTQITDVCIVTTSVDHIRPITGILKKILSCFAEVSAVKRRCCQASTR